MQPPDARSALAATLLQPRQPVPAGWASRAGSDATRRLAVYRNNVVHSLVAALGETYPVCRRFVGAEAFDALAAGFLRLRPPHTPVLSEWGDELADFVPSFFDTSALPLQPMRVLSDLARLEWARQQAWHAADASAIDAAELAAALAHPPTLLRTRLVLHPSLHVLSLETAAVSVWAAHQEPGNDDANDEGDAGDGVDLAHIQANRAEAAWVLRPADEVLVVPVSVAQARWAAQMQAGAALGEADLSGLDLGATLALLLQHEALCALHAEN